MSGTDNRTLHGRRPALLPSRVVEMIEGDDE
jgi:hypothetical protein